MLCALAIVAGMALLAAAPASAATGSAERPNVVVIVIDDFGWADLGCYGSTFHETPNIDKLAARGMRFTSGYAACPVCSPSRAALMTGRYPARLHLTDWLPGRPDRPAQKLLRPKIRQELPLEEITLAEALKPAAYRSGSIGKWHLGGPGFWPQDQGFDINLGGTQTGSPPGGYFRFKTPSLSARSDSEYLTDRLTEEALGFIKANKDHHFFLYLPYYAVHIPLQAKPDLVARYRAKPSDGTAQSNPIYAAMIQSVDEGVGRIVQSIEELGLAGRTLIVFTSDNGGLSVKEGANTPATSNAPLRAGKGYLYEGGIRVPWIFCWPGAIAAGSLCDAAISHIDLLPTLAELAGVSPAAGREIDGTSLVPLLKGSGSLSREALFWHYPHYSNQGGRPGGAIRAGDLKLIEFYEDNHVELYDLKADPSERTDLAAQQPDVAAQLRNRLAHWRKQVDAQMPTPNPDYRPAP